jgi:hypothetical protein
MSENATSPARRSANHAQVYASLWATSLTPEFHEKTCGYWFIVTNGAAAHTAFATRAGLDRWISERGLALKDELADAGTVSNARITGTYRTVMHGEFSPSEDDPYRMTEGDWPPPDPVLATAVMSNGQYTLGLITEDDGVRTVHTLNPNVRTRLIFDRQAAARWLAS